MRVLNSPGTMGRIINTVSQSMYSPSRIVAEPSGGGSVTGSGGRCPKSPNTPMSHTHTRSSYGSSVSVSGSGGTRNSHSSHSSHRNSSRIPPTDVKDTCIVHKLIAHKQEVCGLKISPSGRQIATGGNDNKLCIWDIAGVSRVSKSHRSSSSPGVGRNRPTGPTGTTGRPTTGEDGSDSGSSSHNSSLNSINSINGVDSSSTLCPIYKFHDHIAAVKAVAWSPHQSGLLATGGGTADRHIRYWNTHTGECISAYDTGSQVCNLVWSTSVNELVSTHGYSLNQVIVWKYPTMTKLATLHGHTSRYVLLVC